MSIEQRRERDAAVMKLVRDRSLNLVGKTSDAG